MHEPLDESAYHENTSDKWDISWYTTRECCITILHHAVEHTMANTVNATYAWHLMERMDVIPSNIQGLSFILILGCILYSMVFMSSIKLSLQKQQQSDNNSYASNNLQPQLFALRVKKETLQTVNLK